MSDKPTLGEMIRFSWNRSKEILFPFQFKRWFKILIIVWLAAAGIQGCNLNFNIPKKPATPSPVRIQPIIPAPQLPQVVKEKMDIGGAAAAGEQTSTQLPAEKQTLSVSANAEYIAQVRAKMEPAKPKINPMVVVPLIIGMILFGVSFMLFFMWLTCRFNFILLDTLITKKTAIRDPFRQYKEIGDSYFKWSLGFLGISLGAIAVVILLTVILMGIAKGNAALSILSLVFGGLPALLMALAMIGIGTAVHDFVLPIMYQEKLPTMRALNQFRKSNAFNFNLLVQYLLVVLGLWVLAMIVQAIVSIVALLGGLIAGAVVAIPGIILLKAVPLLKIPLLILGVFLVIALIFAIAIAIGMVMLPVTIFFRVFALTYLTRLYPECDLLGFAGDK